MCASVWEKKSLKIMSEVNKIAPNLCSFSPPFYQKSINPMKTWMFLYNEAPIQVWKSQYDSWAKSIGNFTTFFVPCNLVRCGRIIEACGTGRQGPPGLEGQKEGGCLAAVLLNTNRFALGTKEQMSSLTHCVLLAHSTRSSAALFPVAPAAVATPFT